MSSLMDCGPPIPSMLSVSGFLLCRSGRSSPPLGVQERVYLSLQVLCIFLLLSAEVCASAAEMKSAPTRTHTSPWVGCRTAGFRSNACAVASACIYPSAQWHLQICREAGVWCMLRNTHERTHMALEVIALVPQPALCVCVWKLSAKEEEEGEGHISVLSSLSFIQCSNHPSSLTIHSGSEYEHLLCPLLPSKRHGHMI